MTFKNQLIIFLLFFISFTVIAQEGKKSAVIKTIDGKKFYIHSVEKGQSLYAVAKLYNLDLNSLLVENPDAIDGLKTGDELKIPFKPDAVESVTSPGDIDKYNFHKVEKKETVYGICHKYKITETQLLAMNPEIKNGLKEGQLLKVGLKEIATAITPNANFKTDSAYQWHQVKNGETVYSISQLYGASLEEIQKLNGGLPGGVKAGEKIRIKEKVNTALNSVQGGNTVYGKDTTRLPARPKKNKYNVGICLPLQTTDVEMLGLDFIIQNKKNFPNVSALTCDFYEGYLKALDSLKSNDFEINTFIFDVNENDSAGISVITAKEEFKKLDFIIGPWYASAFRSVSIAAKNLGIGIVSPTIQHNKILFQNPFVSKIQPAKNSLIETLADFAVDSLKQHNIMIVNNDKLRDQNSIRIFKKAYNDSIKLKYKLNDTIREVKGLSGVKAAFSDSKKNVVVFLTENKSSLTEFFTQLGVFLGDKKEITVVGNHFWMSNDNLDAGYYNRYGLICAAPFWVDKEMPLVKKLWLQYREVYFSDPDDIYFQSYDMTFYYLNRLKTDGPDFFMTLNKNKFTGAVMDFNFYSPNPETGFENRSGIILKVKDFKLIKAK